MPELLQPKPQVQSTAWQDEQNTWDVIKAKFGITENRYESFTFLKYLDLDDKYVKNYVYYHLGKEQPIIIGRMSKHIEFWKTLHTPDWVLSIIEAIIIIDSRISQSIYWFHLITPRKSVLVETIRHQREKHTHTHMHAP